jgi:hypothetical protein
MARNDFWLFPEIKSALEGRKFQDIENIKKKKKCDDGTESYSTTGIPKRFQQWQHRWANFIATSHPQFWLKNLKGRDYWEELGVDGKIILEWILGKQSGEVWTGCIWLMIGASGGPL